MPEHFNENFMLSDQMPHSTFSGKVTNLIMHRSHLTNKPTCLMNKRACLSNMRKF